VASSPHKTFFKAGGGCVGGLGLGYVGLSDGLVENTGKEEIAECAGQLD
jgi:hypothetical protein